MACCWFEMRPPAAQTVLSEEDALAATGVCSGDLLWVHTTSPMDVAAPAATSSLAAPMPPCPALPAENTAAVQQQPQAQLVPGSGAGCGKAAKGRGCCARLAGKQPCSCCQSPLHAGWCRCQLRRHPADGCSAACRVAGQWTRSGERRHLSTGGTGIDFDSSFHLADGTN